MSKVGTKREMKRRASSNCSICNSKLDYDKSFIKSYPNLVCSKCDEKAVSENNLLAKHAGEDPQFIKYAKKESKKKDTFIMPPDGGDNPVYIEGKKCWRRYRFGGWITMYDPDDLSTEKEFYNKHFRKNRDEG